MHFYEFHQKNLKPNFAADKVALFKEWINQDSSFCLLSIPGIGVTNFLRFFISTQRDYYFIFVDAFALASPTKHAFFAQILKEIGIQDIPDQEQQLLERCRQELERLCQKETVVLIFNRFNQLTSIFDAQLFANIRWLQIVNRDRIRIICTSNVPLYEMNPEAVGGSNLYLFSTLHYFPPYSPLDLKQLNPEANKEAINLCGGHVQLLQLITKAEGGPAVYKDPFIRLQLKAIVDNLKPADRRQLSKLMNPPANLVKLGLMRPTKSGWELFTPLLTAYLKSVHQTKLPKHEAKLYKILHDHLGHVVSKEDIFQAVWANDWTEASDWALNSLIYRLRKHPFLADYVLESHKKQGYSLAKHA